MLANYLGDRNPALIVLAYGTNEASNPGLTQEGYRELFAKVVARFREAAPTASILVIGPPDRYIRVRGKWTPYNAVDIIVTAQREAALSGGCAFWDWRGKMGGKGSMRSWFLAGLAQYDHVHLTGSGYKSTADALFRDMMAQYALFVKAREEH
jgi:lysophospholipase L1-like esterase